MNELSVEDAFMRGAISALRKRALELAKQGNERMIRGENGKVYQTSESAMLARRARDLASTADELEEVKR